jgi:chromosome segregation ATPase
VGWLTPTRCANSCSPTTDYEKEAAADAEEARIQQDADARRAELERHKLELESHLENVRRELESFEEQLSRLESEQTVRQQVRSKTRQGIRRLRGGDEPMER